jgi:cytochrome c biogenesis protein CcdA
MIVLAFAVVGAILGAITARRRKGVVLDMAQYAAGYGIAFALLGLFASFAIARFFG